MRPLFLHLDDALATQGGLRERALEQGLLETQAMDLGPALRLWSRPRALGALAERLRTTLQACNEPLLTFVGSGDFHHVSPLLVARAIEAAAAPVTILHFDNHPDWVRFTNGMHCGSWVARAARLPGVVRVITAGVCSSDIMSPRSQEADTSLVTDNLLELYPYHVPSGDACVRLWGREWPSIASLGEAAFIELMVSRIPTRAIYVTIDKDVLHAGNAITNWDQGCASLAFVRQAISRAAEDHVLIGADVVGDWSLPHYGGWLARGLKWAEALIDQPRRRPDAATLAVNQAANLELLQLFREVAPA